MRQQPTSDSSTPFAGRDRRRHPRATADWPLELQLGAVKVPARLRDVSRSGICFFLERAIPEMTVLGLDVALPEEAGSDGVARTASASRRIRARGVVVRCERLSAALEHYEVAVFFHQIDKADAAAIDEIVLALGAR